MQNYHANPLLMLRALNIFVIELCLQDARER